MLHFQNFGLNKWTTYLGLGNLACFRGQFGRPFNGSHKFKNCILVAMQFDIILES